MARKRGGLAGIWDRNKGAIKLLAPMALGMIPGVGVPLAAAAGAAMGGFDRPGKRGIGFDLGGGVKGGLSGAASGMTGAGIKKGVASLFTAKAPPTAANFATQSVGQNFFPGDMGGSSMLNPLAAAPAPAMSLSAATGGVSPAAIGSGASPLLRSGGGVGGGGGGGSRISRLLSGAKNNWEMVSDVGKGINTMLGAQGQEAMARQKLEQDRMAYEQQLREFNLKRTETEAERESRRRLTQLLMPFIQAQFSNVLPSQSAPAPTPRAG